MKKYSLNFIFWYIQVFGMSQTPLFEHFTTEDGLPSNKLNDLFFDNNGTLWIASDNGVTRLNGLSFETFSVGNEKIEKEVIGIYMTTAGKIGCYSATSMLYLHENLSFLPHPLNRELVQKIENRIINSLAIDETGTTWISTVLPKSIFKIKPKQTHVEELSESLNDFSFFAKQISNVSFISGALPVKNQNNRLKVHFTDVTLYVSLSSKGNYAKSVFISLNDGTYLYAKEQELVRMNKEKVLERTFVEKTAVDVMQSENGKIWVGLHQGGAICYPEGKLSSAGVLNYLGNKTVSSIIEDVGGNVWFATQEDGLFFLSLRPITAYSPPKIFSSNDKNTVETISGAVSEKKEHKISSIPDFRVMSTDTSIYDTIPPTVHISGVRIVERDTAVMDRYNLSYSENFIKINFVGLTFNNAQQLQYRYKLNGIDKEWVYTNSSFAQYTTLPDGKFLFSVYSMNKNGLWSDFPATVLFEITPPFWKTWWVILSVSVSVIGLSFLGIYYRIARIKRRENEKSDINRQIAGLELQALRSQMNPHFIFNTLSSIQHFITNNDTEAALRYLSKFARLMRKIMENSTQSLIPIKDEVDALTLYLELESLRFKNKFDYAIIVGESIDKNYDEIPAMLIQPYVENAILHGILHKEGKGEISVSLKKHGNHIWCTVKDNGVGREKSRKINRNKIRSHESAGMEITQHRLQIINKSRNSNLDVSITDLKDKEANALGTEVTIYIPI